MTLVTLITVTAVALALGGLLFLWRFGFTLRTKLRTKITLINILQGVLSGARKTIFPTPPSLPIKEQNRRDIKDMVKHYNAAKGCIDAALRHLKASDLPEIYALVCADLGVALEELDDAENCYSRLRGSSLALTDETLKSRALTANDVDRTFENILHELQSLRAAVRKLIRDNKIPDEEKLAQIPPNMKRDLSGWIVRIVKEREA